MKLFISMFVLTLVLANGMPVLAGVRDFHDPEVTKQADADLIAITKKGKGKMPAYDGKLTDDQIKGIIKYIRTLK